MLIRSRWAAIGAAVAVSLGAGGLGMVAASVNSGDRPVTVTITPERVLDTRVDLGLTGPFVNETPRDIKVTGSVPVASGGSKTVVPADATAVLVNVTVVRPSDFGFLSVRPGGSAGRPTTSTVNFTAGSIEPNAATVDLGPGGKVQIYFKTGSPTGTGDVLLDIVGYTIHHTHDDRYHTKEQVDAASPAPLTASNHAGDTSIAEFPAPPTVLVATSLTAPGDGKVTVTAGAHVYNMGEPVDSMQCTISTTAQYDVEYGIYPDGSFSSARVFDVAAGENNTFSLVCTTSQSGNGAFNNFISAIFTPAA